MRSRSLYCMITPLQNTSFCFKKRQLIAIIYVFTSTALDEQLEIQKAEEIVTIWTRKRSSSTRIAFSLPCLICSRWISQRIPTLVCLLSCMCCLKEFPYNFEPGVSHFLLWSLKPLSDSEVEKALSEHRKECEIIIFQNPPSLSSIPGLWHIHIVSRKRTWSALSALSIHSSFQYLMFIPCCFLYCWHLSLQLTSEEFLFDGANSFLFT